jgi:hypothetical protein
MEHISQQKITFPNSNVNALMPFASQDVHIISNLITFFFCFRYVKWRRTTVVVLLKKKKEEIMFKGLSIQKKSVLCVFHVSIKLQK